MIKFPNDIRSCKAKWQLLWAWATLCIFSMLSPVEADAAYRSCDDQQVYLAVMDSARKDLPQEFKQWTLRGSQGIETLEDGKCKIKLLFVTGRSDGRMTEIWATFDTSVPLSKIKVALLDDGQGTNCKHIDRSSNGFVTLVSGQTPPEASHCYLLRANQNENIKIEVRSWKKNTVATILDIGDARSEFEFLAETRDYEIHIFQLFRSFVNDEYAVILEIR